MKGKENETRSVIKISVRNLVEFILREGDIDNRVGRGASAEAMQEGSRIHRKIQRRKGSNYHAEVPLKLVLTEEKYDLIIEGRADGIQIDTYDILEPMIWNTENTNAANSMQEIMKQNFAIDRKQVNYADNFNHIQITDEMYVTIDEIKGVYRKLDAMTGPVMVHKAQAMCYAYIYALQHDITRIGVQMTYCNLDTEDIRYFNEEFTFEELQKWFFELIEEYKKWADFQYEWRKCRQASIKGLQFPYEYRKGQKDLAAGVYRTINRKKNLFIQAPTGVGKTISTVFPSVKAVGEELGDRIFYLTAKTITGTVAKEAFELLRKDGYQAKIIQITAKEKMCLCEEMECNPVHCPYAKGHFDRVNDAVYELLQQEDVLTREVIQEQAKVHTVCPFELCLDLSSWCDNIICDYNYVFDPNVYLKRFFAEGIRGDYIFLVDEAHNLVERSREMYSAQVYKEDFLEVKKLVKRYDSRLENDFNKCNKILLDYKRECEKYVIYDNIGNFVFALQRLASNLDEFLQKQIEFPERKTVTEFYLNIRNFLNIYELLDSHYVIYSEHTEDGRFMLKLYCVDPSANLQNCLNKGNATIFFSATLLPIQYYKSLLSTKEDNYAIYAETAFLEEQRLLLVGRDVSSKYTRRNQVEFSRIADYIAKTASAKRGNYMVFFPSYKMMQQVYEMFKSQTLRGIDTLLQENGMREDERESFLAEFTVERDNSLVAFCVMGGIFGEGIDLKYEQLIGAIIVGTGLPQISNEREILMNYYEKVTGLGFDYAYRYPGMNKVLQAAGRVIRTIEDIGVIELLDERFLQSDYRCLFPREWENYEICSVQDIETYLKKFWEKR
ncbi:MAG: ATP-dependent DNA helicase [Roseburia sp.]|nr:ATP-dependent DNA helicase [Roseburia sp.]